MISKEKVYFKTFGCRTNVFDTQVMMNNLKDFEITQSETDANVVIINSCTVTNSADSTARNYINSLKKLPKSPRVIFTGCGVWTKGEDLFKNNKIDALFGHSEKENINTLLKNDTRFFKAGDLEHLDETIVDKMIGKSRAFVKIQEGCDFRCNYCIIPYVRGNSRSYEEHKILQQITTLAINGFGEFILTGINVGSYGKEKGVPNKKDKLVQLIKKISLIRGVRRIRLGSVEPVQITDEFKEILDEPWMGKHMHIALQHTNKDMLKIMNRRNKVKSDLELFEFLASKGYALGTDFIVGHPGETDALWKDAMQNIDRFPLTHVHSFTYSPRDGTPSAKMGPQINGNIAKERLRELENKIKEKNFNFRQHNQPLEVLIESKKGNIYTGYDQFFNTVEVQSEADLVGDWINVEKYEILENKNVSKF